MLTSLRSVQRGFTMLELMVTVVILAILIGIGMPQMAEWIQRMTVSSASELIQNGLRQAIGEAIRRNTEVDFILTDGTPSVSGVASLVAKQNGINWAIRVVDATASNRYVNGSATNQLSDSVTYQGPAGVRFTGSGRVLDLTGTAVGGKQIFRVTRSGSGVAYCVFVTPGAAVKMCDPSRASGDPRACQPILTASECTAA
ncbi:GspH/FimT family pseudopilin [Zoogloea sp.]|uniref:GspH/FimT family pseudopilin n=1 Tax=Zoogloea sp. TaxID=49181 RepID=UPI001415BDC0|nr:MAG: prepilin-type N-terminal cleavage/methylation domain-containing protein [Zoogloea sp.]